MSLLIKCDRCQEIHEYTDTRYEFKKEKHRLKFPTIWKTAEEQFVLCSKCHKQFKKFMGTTPEQIARERRNPLLSNLKLIWNFLRNSYWHETYP